jgi:hypothetical protein
MNIILKHVIILGMLMLFMQFCYYYTLIKTEPEYTVTQILLSEKSEKTYIYGKESVMTITNEPVYFTRTKMVIGTIPGFICNDDGCSN